MSQTSVRRGFFILSRTNLFIKLISILYVPILLAIIGPAGHGDYALAYVYYGAMVALLCDALIKIMIRQVSSLEVKGQAAEAMAFTKEARRLVLLMSLGLAVIVVLSSGYLARMLHAPHLRYSLMVLGMSLVFVSLAAIYRAYFQATRRMDVAANALLIDHILNAILTVALPLLLRVYGLEISLAGAAVGSLIGGLVSLVYLQGHLRKKSRQLPVVANPHPVFPLIKPLLWLSLALQLGAMIEAAIMKLRLSQLGLNETLASIVYSDMTSYKMAQSIPMILVSAMATALYPAITESVAQGDIKRFYHRVEQAIRNNYLITIPAATGIALVARELVQFVFDGRLQREQMIIAAAFMIIPMGIGLIQSVILQADGRMMVSQLPLVISVGVQILADFLFIKQPFGIWGIIVVGYLGLLSLCVSNHFLIKHRHLVLNYTRDFIKPVLAALVMTVVLIGLKYILPASDERLLNLIHMLLLIGVGGMVYLVSLLLMRFINREDVSVLSASLYDRLPAFIKRWIVADERGNHV